MEWPVWIWPTAAVCVGVVCRVSCEVGEEARDLTRFLVHKARPRLRLVATAGACFSTGFGLGELVRYARTIMYCPIGGYCRYATCTPVCRELMEQGRDDVGFALLLAVCMLSGVIVFFMLLWALLIVALELYMATSTPESPDAREAEEEGEENSENLCHRWCPQR